MRIDIWMEVGCPWCFIATRRFQKALAQFPHRDQVEVFHRHFIVDPALTQATPTEQYLAQTRKIPQNLVKDQFKTLSELGEVEGITFNWDQCISAPTRYVHRIINAAGSAATSENDNEGSQKVADSPAQSKVLDSFFRAEFCDGMDLSDRDQAVMAAVRAGMNREYAEEVFSDESRDELIMADVKELLDMTVSSVPFFLFAGKYGASGAHSINNLVKGLEQSWQAYQEESGK